MNQLFDIDEIREVAKTLDTTPRGTDDEYNMTVLSELTMSPTIASLLREAKEVRG